MSSSTMISAPLCAFLIGRVAMLAVRRAALALGFVDNPDLRRKLQESPIPLGGGVAVWLAAWSGWAVVVLYRSPGTAEALKAFWAYAPLVAASFAVLALGVVDDRFGMRGRDKLVGQLASAAILVAMGLRIDAFSGFGFTVELGALAYPVTIFWIILVVNAFNLVDGMDGFCGSLGLVASISIAVLCFGSGRTADACLALAVAGALAAFLLDNLPPARIYLGDSGSMTLGLILSALSIRACSEGPGSAVSLPPMLALMALPLLDVATALGRRWLTGRSLFTPDRGHLHHRLRARLGSTSAALGVAVLMASLGAFGAILAKGRGLGDFAAFLAVVASVALLAGTGTFGGSELRLLMFRSRSAATRFFSGLAARRVAIRHECHILGARDWARVWSELVQSVEGSGVWRVELAIDMPAAGETYHGLWSLPRSSSSEGGQPGWSVTHTLHVEGLPAGSLRVAGGLDEPRSRYLDHVEELIRSLEGQLGEEFTRVPGRDLGPKILPAQLTLAG